MKTLPVVGLLVLFAAAVAVHAPGQGLCTDSCSTLRAPRGSLVPCDVPGAGTLTIGEAPASLPPSARGGPRLLEPPAGYALLDERETTIWLPVGERYVARADTLLGTLDEILPPSNLTALAEQAAAFAPTWLRGEIRDRFRMLSPADQDSYAGIILNAPDPRIVDEVAFQVAHIPVPVLTSASFYRELLTENATDLYRFDADLPYAEIVDYGDPATGGDYYSTVRYRALDENGNLLDREFPRDIYYWYIVHPKIQDEMATHIDPDATGMDTPAPPPTGRFWREYLWNSADPNPTWPGTNYLSLGEMLRNATTLWSHKRNQEGARNGAVGVVSEWMDTVMRYDLPPSGERSLQPVRILRNHCGRCGEQQDLLAAAGRTALIPTYTASAWANDHVWAEFYEDGKWRLWDCSDNAPAVIDPPNYYDHWGYGGVSAVSAWRGDGWVWTVTDKYTPYATLNVTVQDRNGSPVDGAVVWLATWFNTGPNTDLVYLTWSWTDTRGETSFLLGDQKEIFVKVQSPLGNFPIDAGFVARLISPQTEAGQTYNWTYSYDNDPSYGTVPALQYTPAAPGPGIGVFLEATWSSPRDVVYGQALFDSRSLFACGTSPGDLSAFLCDSANYSAYDAGGPFEGYALARGEGGGAPMSLEVPAHDTWNVVFANDEELGDTEVLTARVSLYEYRDDLDADGVPNAADNCVEDPNPAQDDGDGDTVGDVCDNCPALANTGQDDGDGDTLGDGCDSCPADPENDVDSDGICADADNCPDVPNPGHEDADADTVGDPCDVCPSVADPGQEDLDSDGAGDPCDNCPGVSNPGQEDTDGDGTGDACELPDTDGDTVPDPLDNCILVPNPLQENADNDGYGDACDTCPRNFNPGQFDQDGDTYGDACDCNPAIATVWILPGEIRSLQFTGPTTLAWESDEPYSGPGIRYDVIRGIVSSLRLSGGIGRALCLPGGTELTGTTADDPAIPPAGGGFFYLVRGSNDCLTNSGNGSYGTDSTGTGRGVPASDDCP